jgi:replicative DNA helicase
MTDKDLSDPRAEQHLVGNLLFNPKFLPLIAQELKVENFTDLKARILFEEMLSLYASPERPHNPVELEAALAARGFDLGYLDELQGEVLPVGIEDLQSYVKRIENSAELRAVQRMLKESLLTISPEASADDVRGKILMALTDKKTESKWSDIGTVAERVDGQVTRWASGEVDEFVPSGFADLDKKLRLKNERLYLIAARPSMGKTSLGLQICYNAAKKISSGCTAFFSAEMSKDDLALRMACIHSSVSGEKVEQGKASADEMSRVRQALADMKRVPMHIDDDDSPTVRQMFYRLSLLNASSPVRLMVFDFMELGSEEKRSESEELRLSRLAQGLKSIAKTLHIPVIALSQLNRKVEDRNDKMPQLSDLRYSGMLEQVANVAILLWRYEYYAQRNGLKLSFSGEDEIYLQPGIAMIILAKNRDGRVGRFPMVFTEEFARFGDLASKERGESWWQK